MKKALRVLAAMILLTATGLWVATGTNRSLTITNRKIVTVDPVTGLDRVEWKDTFVPGVDFLAAAVVLAVMLFGVSFFFRKKKTGT